MSMVIEEWYIGFRQAWLADSTANEQFRLESFVNLIRQDLVEIGYAEDIDVSLYRSANGAHRVDGYWFGDDGQLDLYIADFDQRDDLETLTRIEIDRIKKKPLAFFEACEKNQFTESLEITSPAYDLARRIRMQLTSISRVRVIVLSERVLSDRVTTLESGSVLNRPYVLEVWDVGRLHRMATSKGQKEPLDLNLVEDFGEGLPCLRAHIGDTLIESYLVVAPAKVIAGLYERHGSRLLEQNVRTFLQVRGKINKGIRDTILKDPGMFFSYNNGITATAQAIEIKETESGAQITRIVDLQIVNGGQTTASLFHAHKKDKANLSKIFVQMKLSLIDSVKAEIIVPKISEYANTQNRVNAADFFSNHPFHVRMEEISRRLFAPQQPNETTQTKWFYERTRGQYMDQQSMMTPSAINKFRMQNPKTQMFTKTDLAKYENVFGPNPRYVHLGSQKNFAEFAKRIADEWGRSEDARNYFNDLYFKRVVARSILYRTAEKIVSKETWYNNGYRANIVSYTLSVLGRYAENKGMSVNYMNIWNAQGIDEHLSDFLKVCSKFVFDILMNPTSGSNISEWAKREECWIAIKNKMNRLDLLVQEINFDIIFIPTNEMRGLENKAIDEQKMRNEVELQTIVMEKPKDTWSKLLRDGIAAGLLDDTEMSIIRVAEQMTSPPYRLPSVKQCMRLSEIMSKVWGD